MPPRWPPRSTASPLPRRPLVSIGAATKNKVIQRRTSLSADLVVDNQSMALTVRRHPRARRMTLRLAVDSDGVIVTIPANAPFAAGVELARRSTGWIARRLSARPERVAFIDAAVIPLRGTGHRVRHQPGQPGGVVVEGGQLLVGGAASQLGPRLEAWLREQARGDLTAEATAMAPRLRRMYGRIGVRDPRSRWGSCAASGNLSFSWRLILAPPPILTYVVAHELAHLVERNHGPRFWAIVGTLVDDTAGVRAWLQRHGPALHRYG